MRQHTSLNFIKQIITIAKQAYSYVTRQISHQRMYFFDTSCQKPKGKNFVNPQNDGIWKDGNQKNHQIFQLNSDKNNPENRTVNNNWGQSQPNKNVNIQNQTKNFVKKWTVAESPQTSKKVNKSKSFNNVALKKVFQEYRPKADKISIKQIKKTDFKELKKFRQSGGTLQLSELSKLHPNPNNTPIQSTPSRRDHKEPQNHKHQNFVSNPRSEFYLNDDLSPSSNNSKINGRQNPFQRQGDVFDYRNTIGNKQHSQYLRKIIRYESQNQNYQKDLGFNENQPTLQKYLSQKQFLRNTTGGALLGNVFRKQWQNTSNDYPSMKSSNSGSPPVSTLEYNFNALKNQKPDDAINSVRSPSNIGKAGVNYAMHFYVPPAQNRINKVSSATRIPNIKFVTCQTPQYTPKSALDTPNKVKSMENIPEQENQEKQDLVFPKGLSNFEKFSRRFFKLFDGFQKQLPRNVQMNMNINIQQIFKAPGEAGVSPISIKKQTSSPTIPLQRTNSYTCGSINGKHEKSKQKNQILDSQKIQLVSSEEFGSPVTIEPKFQKIKTFIQKHKAKKPTQSPEMKFADSSSLEKTVQKRGAKRLNQNTLNENRQRYSESSVQQLSQNFGNSSRGLSPTLLKRNSAKSKPKLDTLAVPIPLTPKMTESQCDKNDDSQSQKSNSSIVLYNAKMLNLSPNKNTIKPEKITEFAYKKFDQLISRGKYLVYSKHCESPTLKVQKGKLGSTGIQEQNFQHIDQALVGKRGSHAVQKANEKESIIQPCEQWSPSKAHTMKNAELQKAQMLKKNPDSKLWKINVVESVIDLQLIAKKSKKYNQRID